MKALPTREAATARDLRQRNRGAVLRSILRAGETTRTRLAVDCGLSQATVTNVVTELLADGLVRDGGSFPSNGGRPTSRLSVVPTAAYFIGADVGEQGVTVELFDFALQRIDSVFQRNTARSTKPENVAASASSALERIRSSHPETASALVGVGLGLPGVVDTDADGTTTIHAQSLGWPPTNVDAVFPSGDLPVFADNGAKTLATAEHWFGAASDVSHAIVALLGRGLGAGVIVDGHLYRGSASSAGEWGHTKVSIGGPRCRCGGHGCLEAYVGGDAIAARWKATGAEVSGASEGVLTRLVEAAAGGDSAAVAVLSETVEIVGLGLANLVNLFNPERLVIGGWCGLQLFDAGAAELATAVKQHALSRPGEQFTLERCRLGTDAVALGAALLPLERFVDGTILGHVESAS
jgi:predicted NBD/HSP70 family sugar kinase